MKRLWVWTGPVSAEKSTKTLTTVKRLQRQKSVKHSSHKNIIVQIRPTSSRRQEEPEEFSLTKNGARFPCVYLDCILDLEDTLNELKLEPDIVWLDEIHFWENQSVHEDLREWTEKQEIAAEDIRRYPYVAEVITPLREKYMFLVSCIGADTNLKPICPSMGALLQTADRIYHEVADCDWCGSLNAATRSVYVGLDFADQDKLKGNRQEALVELGGEETYKPACPECWIDIKNLPVEERIKLLATDF